MKRLPFLLILAVILCGCEFDPPERFAEICGQKFGKTDYQPEKRIISCRMITPDDMLEISITPISNVVWQISLVIPEFPGGKDAVAGAKKFAESEFKLRFDSGNSLLLPGTAVEISRAFEFGPDAVKITFTDREHEKLFIQENSLPETAFFRKKQQALKDILILEKALADFRKDNEVFPEKLEHLLTYPAGFANWHGPYWNDGFKLPVDPWGRSYIYRRKGNDFELFSTGESGREVLH